MMHLPRQDHDTLDFHGLSLDVIEETESGLICHVESRTDHAETRLALGLAAPGDRVLVAGAGFGGTLLLLARRLGVDAVVGYEPNPLGHRAAAARLGVRGQALQIRPYAVGATHAEHVTFYASDCWPTSSVNPDWAATEGRRELSVGMVELGAALREEGANGLVLDIEGGEIEALSTVDRHQLRWLVVELHGGDNGVLRRDLYETCGRLDLVVRETISGHGTLIAAASR